MADPHPATPTSVGARLLLAARSLFFVLLLPGTITGYVPWRMLGRRLEWPALTPSSVLAALVLLAGAAVLLRCVWDFFSSGRGTLAPVDPPRHLVVSGLYRFTRNPMYNGVVAMLLGEAWLSRSGSLAWYALAVLAGFHLWVLVYEEPALASRFGEEYAAYGRAVPRWGFTVRGFRP